MLSNLTDLEISFAPAEFGTKSKAHFDDAKAPLLRTLYLGEPGAHIRLSGGRLLVSKDDVELLDIPLEKIDQIIVSDEGVVSFAVLRALLARGAGFFIQGQSDEPSGHFISALDSRISLRALQHERVRDLDFNLAIARSLIFGKISNSRLLLNRYYRFRPHLVNTADVLLHEAQSKALTARDLDSLRGIEGSAAKAYFSAWRDLLPAAWESSFPNRNRQPPQDPINAMLSYGYAVLYHNVLKLITARGLEAHLGHLHAMRDGHAALASDLVEEFRALVVDAVVLKLVHDHPYEQQDFQLQKDGAVPYCRIGNSMRKILIERLESKLNSQLTHPLTGESGDFRCMIRIQIAHYIQVIQGATPSYNCFVLR